MLKLHRVCPTPLANYWEVSEIWNTELHFEKGKFYLITARSGKGKSTLLHSIYGLRDDYTGTVLIQNQDSCKLGMMRV